jgi:hypothetical protein
MRVVVVGPRLRTHEFDPGGEEIAQQPARSPYSRQWMLLTGEYLQPHAAGAEGLLSMRLLSAQWAVACQSRFMLSPYRPNRDAV